MPGRTSKTGMPSGARRSANKRAVIDRPALLTQYSPRLSDAWSAETEVMKTMAGGERRIGPPLRHLLARDRLREEVRPLQVGADELLEAVLVRVEEVGTDARRAPGVVDQGVHRAVRARAISRRVGRDRARLARSAAR